MVIGQATGVSRTTDRLGLHHQPLQPIRSWPNPRQAARSLCGFLGHVTLFEESLRVSESRLRYPNKVIRCPYVFRELGAVIFGVGSFQTSVSLAHRGVRLLDRLSPPSQKVPCFSPEDQGETSFSAMSPVPSGNRRQNRKKHTILPVLRSQPRGTRTST